MMGKTFRQSLSFRKHHLCEDTADKVYALLKDVCTLVFGALAFGIAEV